MNDSFSNRDPRRSRDSAGADPAPGLTEVTAAVPALLPTRYCPTDRIQSCLGREPFR